MELLFPFHTLVELVDAEDNTNKKIHTLDLPLDNNDVTIELASQILSMETFDPNPDCFFDKQTVLITKINANFGSIVTSVISLTESNSNCIGFENC